MQSSQALEQGTWLKLASPGVGSRQSVAISGNHCIISNCSPNRDLGSSRTEGTFLFLPGEANPGNVSSDHSTSRVPESGRTVVRTLFPFLGGMTKCAPQVCRALCTQKWLTASPWKCTKEWVLWSSSSGAGDWGAAIFTFIFFSSSKVAQKAFREWKQHRATRSSLHWDWPPGKGW